MASINVKKADAIILESKYAEMVEEYEETPEGHVYGLSNGLAVLVDNEGRIIDSEDTEYPATVCDKHAAELVGWDEAFCPLC